MITEADIEKLIYRCFENYWNTRMSKKHNLARVSRIAGNDVWQVVKQYFRDEPNKHTSLYVHGPISTTQGDVRDPSTWKTTEQNPNDYDVKPLSDLTYKQSTQIRSLNSDISLGSPVRYTDGSMSREYDEQPTHIPPKE